MFPYGQWSVTQGLAIRQKGFLQGWRGYQPRPELTQKLTESDVEIDST
jgi:hypothetical protein